jgi:hypothetical protein
MIGSLRVPLIVTWIAATGLSIRNKLRRAVMAENSSRASTEGCGPKHSDPGRFAGEGGIDAAVQDLPMARA